VLGRALALRLQHRLGHFLHEQRNAVGSLNDVLSNPRRQLLVADDAVNYCADFALRQAIDRERSHMRLSDPGRLEFRSESYYQQEAKGPNPVHSSPEHFQARGVGSMCILEDHEHRILACQGLQLPNERFHCSLPALLRSQFVCGIAPIVPQR
jgi:hypothetical protein